MDPFEHHYYSLTRKMLSFLGLWHNKTYRERLFRYYVVGLMLFYFTFTQFCQLLKVDWDLKSILFTLQSFIPTVSIASVYYTYVVHFESIKKMFSIIVQDWQQLKNDVELKICQKYAYQCKLYTLISGLTIILFIGSFILPPIFRKIYPSNEGASSTDRFPIFSCHDYFLNPDTYYYYILMCQIMVAFIESIVLVSCYSAYFIMVQHICAQLIIIKGKICQPFLTNYSNDGVFTTPPDRSGWIIDITQRLARCRELTTLMNTICEKCYFFQTMMASILITISFLCLFQIPVLLNQKENKKDIFVFTIFTIGVFFPVYATCYIGQRLIDYGMDVYEEACLVPIYKISLKTQKLLLTTIILNDKPFVMSIGKVFVSSHEFFQSLLRMSLSFAMVVHSMQNI